MLLTDRNEILLRGPWWYNKEMIKFGGDLSLLRRVIEQKHHNNSGVGNGPDALGLSFQHQGPTFIHAYSQAATNLVDQDSVK